ncbi:MAG: hypothetical protein E6772_07715 [Dysgonomonas sp.]|nr:hypothetical protein [Dysgonomonas sp.]
MKITTTDLTARIESGDSTFTHPINTISYVITKQFDGVTLFRGNHEIGSSTFSQTVVNGETLTAENADSLLSSLFVCCNGGGSSDRVQTDYLEENVMNPAYLRNRPISSIQEGEELPLTTIPGHVCKEYDSQNKLKFVYEWDGFVWIKTGANYNLIFDEASGGYTSGKEIDAYRKNIGKTYYFRLEADSIYPRTDQYIQASYIQKLTDEYKLGQIELSIEENQDTIFFDNFDVGQFSIKKSGAIYREVSIGDLTIKNGKCGDISIYEIDTQKIRIENLQPYITNYIDPAVRYTGMYLYGYDISVVNNKFCSEIYVKAPNWKEDSSSQTCKIYLEDNKSAERESGIFIENERDTVLNYDISIINNQDFKHLSIKKCKTINNLNINFNSRLQEINSNLSSFSDKALQNLVYALTSIQFDNAVKFIYKSSQPALSQAQLDALAANNINVEIS